MKLIKIKSPKDVNSVRIKKHIESLALAGFRSREIVLQMDFIANDETLNWIKNEFRKNKNAIYLKLSTL